MQRTKTQAACILVGVHLLRGAEHRADDPAERFEIQAEHDGAGGFFERDRLQAFGRPRVVVAVDEPVVLVEVERMGVGDGKRELWQLVWRIELEP